MRIGWGAAAECRAARADGNDPDLVSVFFVEDRDRPVLESRIVALDLGGTGRVRFDPLVDPVFDPLQLLVRQGRIVGEVKAQAIRGHSRACLLYTSPSPRDATLSRMPSSA